MNISRQKELYKEIHAQPLFKDLADDEFSLLITECELKYHKKSEKVDYYKTPHEGLFLILKGMAEVFIEAEDGIPVLLEVLQEGDVIGFSNFSHYLGEPKRPLNRHTIEMEVIEDSYCLQIPYSVVKIRLKDLAVRDYVLKTMSIRIANIFSSLGEQVKLSDEWGESEPYVRRVQDFMNAPAITVHQEVSVQAIALIMMEKSISSVMALDDNGRLVGIITETDLVQRVVAKGLVAPLIAKDIMTTTLYTVTRHDYYYEVLSMFYKTGVKHLPVVEGENLVGVVTFYNLITKRDRGSMGILRTIEESSFENLPVVKNAIYDVLSNLIYDEISTIHSLEIITRLYDRLARHCVKLAVESLEAQGIGPPPVQFSWYQMGSGARGEQFMLTDQDHFLVYADVPKDQKLQTAAYFSLLGDEIVKHMKQAGYAKCDGKMMSSEEKWRGSVTDWQRRLRTWAIKSTDDHILLAYNFLSFRFLFGDSSLNNHFTKMVQSQLKTSQTFLYYMAQQIQNNNAPQFNQSFLALFKGKEKREVIDIKLHALFPMHHCLQILGVNKSIINGTPIQLLDGLVKTGELSVGFADDVRHAYEVALRTRIQISWKRHLRDEKITTEINFSAIRRWERDELKTMLDTVHSLQSHLFSKL